MGLAFRLGFYERVDVGEADHTALLTTNVSSLIDLSAIGEHMKIIQSYIEENKKPTRHSTEKITCHDMLPSQGFHFIGFDSLLNTGRSFTHKASRLDLWTENQIGQPAIIA